ncbi:hypothetical protein JXA85_08925 [Candidatus Woesearchaeota archaeon]|nr:hypothetical protein [Candidatus Woesearchaeota archaeon]
MQVKIRKQNADGIVRLETTGEIKEVLINEDILHPDKESISICFRGKNSSGIVDLTPAEIEKVMASVRNRIHLIKGIKEYVGSGARRF